MIWRTYDPSCRLLEISILGDDRGRLAAQFEGARDEVLGGCRGDDSTDIGRSDKEDVAPSFLQETGGVADGAEADAVGFCVEVFRYELGKEEGAGFGVFGWLVGIGVSSRTAKQ